MSEEKDKFGYEVLRLLYRNQIDKKNRVDLMVIKWNTAPVPVLENRRMFFDEESGGWRFKKNVGIGLDEMKIIKEEIEETLSLLEPRRSE